MHRSALLLIYNVVTSQYSGARPGTSKVLAVVTAKLQPHNMSFLKKEEKCCLYYTVSAS